MGTTVIIILSVIAVAAICAAVVFYVRFSRQKAETRSRVREVETVMEVKLKAKEEYIAKMEALHAGALKEMDEKHAEAMKKIDEKHAKDMELVQEKFNTAATEIMKKNSQDFSQQSSAKISDLLKPVSEKFEEFRKKVEESDEGRVKMQTSIEEQVKSIMSQAGKVSASADNLANALTTRSKTQGDFGEMVLRDILLEAGLVEGIHFQCQGVITDENGHEVKSADGRTMIPDVVVYYPDGTAVVVDSKVSLTDYVAYRSEPSEAAGKAALNRHVESVRKHVNELADKDYASYIPEGMRKVDYNIMFIPIDGAFTDMLNASPRLWQEARDRKVLIVSQMTLVIVLNMIQLVWRQSAREKNVDSIVAAASELMTQLSSWMSMYESVGTQIEKLAGTYADSTKKLSTSNQSVVQKIRKLERLGAAPRQGAAKASSRKGDPKTVIPASFLSDTDSPAYSGLPEDADRILDTGLLPGSED